MKQIIYKTRIEIFYDLLEGTNVNPYLLKSDEELLDAYNHEFYMGFSGYKFELCKGME